MRDTIYKKLQAEYKSGKTQTELAKMHNVTQAYIQKLLSGARNVGGISVDTVSKMFPEAKLCLGDTVAHGSSNHVNGAGGTQTITNSSADGLVKAIRRVMHDAAMSDAQKVAIAKIICREEKE